MSVFAKDPELIGLLMDLDNNEPFYLTPAVTPAPPVPNLITDDTDTNTEAGRMLDQDASTSETPNEQIVSDDETLDNVQQQAVEKAINKCNHLKRELQRLDTSYSLDVISGPDLFFRRNSGRFR
jgi:hypothetical protein